MRTYSEDTQSPKSFSPALFLHNLVSSVSDSYKLGDHSTPLYYQNGCNLWQKPTPLAIFFLLYIVRNYRSLKMAKT